MAIQGNRDSQDLLGRPMRLLRPCDLFGKATNLITRDGREIDGSNLFFMKERKGVLSAVGEPDWEKVTLTVDSGASDTVGTAHRVSSG